MTSEYMRKPKPKRRKNNLVGRRKCLKCKKTFTSEGKFNRICEKCEASNSKISTRLGRYVGPDFVNE